MITKQQIQDCNDGQQLADWVAEYCKGWKLRHSDGLKSGESLDWWIGSNNLTKDEWQPHQPTEIGKSQCWDLMVKYRMIVMPYEDNEWGATADIGKDVCIDISEAKPQVAILKAALLSEIGE